MKSMVALRLPASLAEGGVPVPRLHLGEVRPSYTRHERKLLLRQIALLAKRPDALSEEYPGCSGQKATTL